MECNVCHLLVSDSSSKKTKKSKRCTCKKCSFEGCAHKIERHCKFCCMPICNFHCSKVSTSSENYITCTKCNKEISLLVEAGDSARVDKLAKNDAAIQKQINQQFILNITVNENKACFKIFLILHPKCVTIDGQKVINDFEKIISSTLFKGQTLYTEYELQANQTITAIQTSKKLDYSFINVINSVSVSTFDVELPITDNKLNITEEEFGQFVKSNQEQYKSNQTGNENSKNEISLIKVLTINKRFYSSLSSLNYPKNWISSKKASEESIKYANAIYFTERMNSICSMNDKLKIGEEINKLVSKVKLSLESKNQVYIPVTWNQIYTNPDSGINVGDIINKGSKNEENTTTSSDNSNSNNIIITGSNVKQEIKKEDKKDEENKKSSRIVLWVLLTPKINSDSSLHVSVSFINTAEILSSLFPKCTQAHVPKLKRKLIASMAFEKKDSQNLKNYMSADNNIMDTTNMAAESVGLRPGNIGTVNKLDFDFLSYDSLDPIITSLFVMQLLPEQKEIIANTEMITNKLVALGSFFSSKLSDNNSDTNDNSPSLLSARNVLSTKTLGNVVDSAVRSRMKTSVHLPFEEFICDTLFQGRSFIDGQILEGHAINILEAILATLQQNHKEKLKYDEESIYPLVPNLSICDSFYLFEKFTNIKKNQLQINILRSIFLLRSASDTNNFHINVEILKDLSQRIFARAMSNPFIFGPSEFRQISELEALKLTLTNILLPIMNDYKNECIKLTDFQNNININQNISLDSKYQIEPLMACLGLQNNDDLPSSKPNHMFWPSKSPFILQKEWFTYSYNEFNQIWSLWFKEAEKMHKNKDFVMLRRIIQNMIDSIPNQWEIFENNTLENIEKHYIQLYNIKENITPQLWINHWSLILLRLNQYFIVCIFERLGNNLRDKLEFKKYGLKPEELLALIKIIVLSDKLYCLPINIDVNEVAPHRPCFNLDFIINHLNSDHYLHTFSSKENELLEKYLQYINNRILYDVPNISSGPQLWSHEDGKNSQIFEGFEKLFVDFDKIILNNISNRVQAYYGGPIPNVDSFGNKNLSEHLAKSLSREREKFSFYVDDRLQCAKINYNNLKNPDHKKKTKILWYFWICCILCIFR